MARSPILGGSSVSRSTDLSDNQLVNLFPEIVETKDGKGPGALYMAPGLDLLTTVGNGPIRGLHVLKDLLYVVSGNEVYRVTTSFNIVLLGTIGSATTPVSMIDNGTQMLISDNLSEVVYIVPGGQPLVGASILDGGSQYANGDTVTLTPNIGTQYVAAVMTVTSVGANGAIGSAVVTIGGAFDPAPTEFSQASTSGSGGGFKLGSLTFGAALELVPVSLPFIPTGKMAEIDGFGLAWEVHTNKLWQSNAIDLSSWDVLNFAFAQASPDNGVTLIATHDELYAIKQRHTTIWVDQGTAGFAFAPLQGVDASVGCIAPFSAAHVGEFVIFLSQNAEGQAIVVEMRGYAPRPISTQALVSEFQGYINIGDAIGFGFQVAGHVFYELIFPEANKTWRYDLTASAMTGSPVWHQVTSLGTADPSFDGLMNRHWSNAFTIGWAGSGVINTTSVTYCADPVAITSPEQISSAGALAGVGASFANFLFNVNLYLPDDGGTHGLLWANQDDQTLAAHNAGLVIQITNDATNTPQVTVAGYDVSNNQVFIATYDYTTWTTWVNFLISVSTTTQTIQVYATTLVSGVISEAALTPVSVTWSSTNPIANPNGHVWYISPFV